jgi:hypothetical protein
MKKIPTIFTRDGNMKITTEHHPDCHWVFNGEGVPTYKIDGTSCLYRDGKLLKRYDAKNGKKPQVGFEPCEEAPDPKSGHWPGWVPINGNDRWHEQALSYMRSILAEAGMQLTNGTYELIGPKINGNPEKVVTHILIPHGIKIESKVPTDQPNLRLYLAHLPYEGVVWHHADGRMAKIKRRDFGLTWPLSDELHDSMMATLRGKRHQDE